MEDPNIIATLVATESESHLARRAFTLAHNRDRYLPPLLETSHSSSRESTPFSDHAQEHDKVHTADRFELTFDKPPKKPRDGFVFGWNSDCDIQLLDKNNIQPEDRYSVQKISRRHFSITFDAQRRVVLRDTSTNGTSVSYDGQAQNEVRSHFTWIIFPNYRSIIFQIPKAGVSFRIQLSEHKTCEAQYFANIDSVFAERKRSQESELTSPVHNLRVRSRTTSTVLSEAATPRQGPIYLLREVLGQGTFGKVYKVVDVSTGEFYAGKTFYRPDWAREVGIMKKAAHEHIVRFVHFQEQPSSLLVMEYVPLGNLADQHRVSPIESEEAMTIVVQGLEALTYLHSQGLVHRDIKPENILVSCRSPLTVRLADLGLAKDSRNGESLFQTWVGSALYAAPEIWKGSPYTPAVDIWSLGVVALEFGFGLPKLKSGEFDPQNWHRRIATAARDQNLNDLGDFLSGSMLRLKPEQRHLASKCLEKALGLDGAQPGKFEVGNLRADSATPTAKFPTFANPAQFPESKKRQRSPDPGFHESCGSSKKTAVGAPSFDRDERRFLHVHPISNPLARSSSQRVAIYGSVLNLLRHLQVKKGRYEISDSRTKAQVDVLCQQFRRLNIVEVKTYNDLANERTIVIAVSEVREFTFASFTSSDLSNSVANLAQHFTGLMRLLSPNPMTSRNSRLSHTCQDNGAEAMESWSTITTENQLGVTYPSALLDCTNVSGCAPLSETSS